VYTISRYYKRQILSEQGKRPYVKDCLVADEICARQSCNRNAIQEFMACLVVGSLGVVERISVVLLAKLRRFNPLIMLLKTRALPAHFSTCRSEHGREARIARTPPEADVSRCKLPYERERHGKLVSDMVRGMSLLAPRRAAQLHRLFDTATANKREPWRDNVSRRSLPRYRENKNKWRDSYCI